MTYICYQYLVCDGIGRVGEVILWSTVLIRLYPKTWTRYLSNNNKIQTQVTSIRIVQKYSELVHNVLDTNNP